MIDLSSELEIALSSPAVRCVLDSLLTEILRREITAMAPDSERLVDAEEAARVLGMSPGAIRKAALRGSIMHCHVGRRLRFRMADLVAPGPNRINQKTKDVKK
jgi:Helix-turn-helix domain